MFSKPHRYFGITLLMMRQCRWLSAETRCRRS